MKLFLSFILIPVALVVIALGLTVSSFIIFWIAPDWEIFLQKVLFGVISIIPILFITVILGYFIQYYLIEWTTKWAGYIMIVFWTGFFLWYLFDVLSGNKDQPIYESVIFMILYIGIIYGFWMPIRNNI